MAIFDPVRGEGVIKIEMCLGHALRYLRSHSDTKKKIQNYYN